MMLQWLRPRSSQEESLELVKVEQVCLQHLLPLQEHTQSREGMMALLQRRGTRCRSPPHPCAGTVVESGLPRARARVSCMLGVAASRLIVAHLRRGRDPRGGSGAHRVEIAVHESFKRTIRRPRRAPGRGDPNHGRTGSIIPIHDPVARKSEAGKQRRRHSSDLLRGLSSEGERSSAQQATNLRNFGPKAAEPGFWG